MIVDGVVCKASGIFLRVPNLQVSDILSFLWCIPIL